ncbi:MAG: hypothetical protein JWR38_5530 [Mucilaginibacter sp.]|nr:hypothetical protein [Mucilaginibacter sp.]
MSFRTIERNLMLHKIFAFLLYKTSPRSPFDIVVRNSKTIPKFGMLRLICN